MTIRHTRSSPWRRGASTAVMMLALAVGVSTTGMSPAAAQVDGVTSASEVVAGQVDQSALDSAVESFDSGDATSAASLVEVIAPETSASIDEATDVSVSEDGSLTLDAPTSENGGSAPSIGISLPGAEGTTTVVDGVTVRTNADTDLDVVARATTDGAQVLSVLGSAEAPNVLSYELDLPEGATFLEQEDGSIAVSAPIEVEREIPGETTRMEAAAAEILGQDLDSVDLDSLTDEDLEKLAQIPDAATETVIVTQTLGEVAAPWAVDADGNPVATEYELDGTTLVQTVKVTPDTTFPVVADPKWYWWAGKAAACGVSIAGFAFSAVKLPKIIAKFKDTLNKTKKGRDLLNKLGGPRATVVKFISMLAQKLPDAIVKRLRSAKLIVNVTAKEKSLLKDLQRTFGAVIAGLTGISRSCFDMIEHL